MSDEIDFPSVPASLLLAEIDAEQDDLLRRLDELNARLETILKECVPPKSEPEQETLPAPAKKAA
jgi:hypothetical protein